MIVGEGRGYCFVDKMSGIPVSVTAAPRLMLVEDTLDRDHGRTIVGLVQSSAT